MNTHIRTLTLALLLTSCLCIGAHSVEPIKVDGRSAETTHTSLQVMRNSLSSEDQHALNQALLKIKINNPEGANDSLMKGPDVLSDEGLLGRRIDGMTFQEILKLSRS